MNATNSNIEYFRTQLINELNSITDKQSKRYISLTKVLNK